MSTSPESNGPSDSDSDETTEAASGPVPEEGSGSEAVAAEEPAVEGQPVAGSTSAAQAAPRPGGVFSAETFGLVGVFLLAMTLLSGQLIELFSTVSSIGDQPVSVAQVAQLKTQVTVSGVLALVTAFTAALALLLSGPGTRNWARWIASAVLITAGLLVIVALLTYLQVPAGVQQQQPMMPTG